MFVFVLIFSLCFKKKNPREKNKVLKPHEIRTPCMEYSIADILPATIANVSFMVLRTF